MLLLYFRLYSKCVYGFLMMDVLLSGNRNISFEIYADNLCNKYVNVILTAAYI